VIFRLRFSLSPSFGLSTCRTGSVAEICRFSCNKKAEKTGGAFFALRIAPLQSPGKATCFAVLLVGGLVFPAPEKSLLWQVRQELAGQCPASPARRGKDGPGQAEKAAFGFIARVSGRRHPADGISGKLPVFFQPAPLPPDLIRLVSLENGKIHVKFPVFRSALSPAGAGGLWPPAGPFHEEYSEARAFTLHGRNLPRTEKEAPGTVLVLLFRQE
jgi:hypothetical protein